MCAVLMLAGLGLAIDAWAAPAAAQTTVPVSRAKEEERTALYREGVSLAEANRWGDALQKFEKVVAIRSAPPALVALATAQERVGKLASAKRTYLEARAQARALGDTGLAERAEKALTAVDGRISRIVVVLPPDAVAAEVRVDGGAVSADPKGIEVDPGEHQVIVDASGQPTFQQRVVLTAEERREVAVHFGPGPAVETPAGAGTPAPATGSGDSIRTGPPLGSWVLGGAGIAASVAGLVIRVNGQRTYDDASANCPNARCATLDEVNAGNAALDGMLAGSIVAGAGVALVASAGLWWMLTPSASKSESTQTTARAISVAPSALNGGAAMIVRGSF